jgi:septum formation protein
MIILASSSPRRRELLTTAGVEFKIAVSDVEEILNPALPPADAAIDVACQKAREIAKEYPNDCVVGADTIVLLDGAILGKPKDKAQAAEMLRMLSGKTHTVYTGVCVIKNGKETCFAEATK